MPCFHPVQAYQAVDGSVKFVERGADFVRSLSLPCGQCVGCRLERSRQWAVRCMHEASMHEASCFVTLTYSDEHLPAHGSLVYRDFQLFMKRLRRARPGARIRFFVGGEYGDELGRPHFHACLFGVSFADRVRLTSVLDRSSEVDKLWRLGMCSLGSVTFESAAYVARYCLKKVNGDLAEAHYAGKVPEFGRSSLRPAVGAEWFARYWRDVRGDGRVVVRGRKSSLPRYYRKLFRGVDADRADELQSARELLGLSRRWDETDARLRVREEVVRAGLLERSR